MNEKPIRTVYDVFIESKGYFSMALGGSGFPTLEEALVKREQILSNGIPKDKVMIRKAVFSEVLV